LQDTLLAHLIVGTALSYVGQIGAAETLLGHAVATRLPEALAPGQGDRGHPFFAELNGHATSPWHSLAMLKVAALEGDSAVLYEICRRAKRFVPKRPDGPAALDPIQKRWQALGHQFELEDDQAVCYAATRGHWRLLAAVGTPWPA
jgi:hypothetical protein